MNTIWLKAAGVLTALFIITPAAANGLSSTQEERTEVSAQAAQENCPDSLYYKSCLGLMPPAYGLDPNAPAAQADPDAPAIDFLNAAENTEIGSWPQVLVSGNFDRQNQADVALATALYFDDANDERLHLMATGDGSADFTRAQRLPAGASPEAMVTADVNLDGLPDVALALGEDDTLAVYTQVTATNPLSGPLSLPIPGVPDALAAGDFSDDLRPDLAAVASANDTIHFWHSSVDGLLPSRTSLPYATDGFDALAAGDLDNDGDDDLAALRGAGFITDSTAIFLQDRGEFPIGMTRTPETGGFLPHSLTIGDVNSDGRDDLIVTAGGNTPNAYLNVFIQGDTGLVTQPMTYTAFHLPSAVAVADINHDGREDVVAVHDAWRSLNVYAQSADGELDPYASIDVPYSSRYRPNAMTLADFDGNGSLDVALVGQEAGLTVLTNELTAPTSTIISPPEAATVPAGTLTVTGTASADAETVEVRLRGGTDWVAATLSGNTWRATIDIPSGRELWTIEARAIDADDHVQAPTARRRIRVVHLLYLPIIHAVAPPAPDLIGSFSLSPDKRDFAAGEEVLITVTITNTGTAKAAPFWVDLYINPSVPPTAANTLWNHVCALTPCYGIAWGVVGGLDPGQSITLTSTPDEYSEGHTIWPGYFVNGTTDLYLYVDSWNPGVATGAAAERNEANNRAELHGLQVVGPNPVQAQSRLPEDLPPRPVLPSD